MVKTRTIQRTIRVKSKDVQQKQIPEKNVTYNVVTLAGEEYLTEVTHLDPITIGVGTKIKIVNVKCGYEGQLRSGDEGIVKKVYWQREHAVDRGIMIDVVVNGVVFGVSPEDIEVVE